MNFFHAVNATPASTRIIQSNLLYSYNPKNTNSYPGSGSTLYDLQGNVDLTITGATYNGNGYFDFDGINDQIKSPNYTLSLPNTTLGVWVKFDASTGLRMTFTLWNSSGFKGYQIYWNGATSRMSFRVEDNAGNFSTLIPVFTLVTGTWYYLAMSWDNTSKSLKGYVYDGTGLALSSSGTASGVDTSASMTSVYNALSDSAYAVDGSIGEAHAYTTPLSQTEITQNYNSTKSRYGY